MGFRKYATEKLPVPPSEPKYKIIKHFGKLTNNEGKWNKELNLISWNDNPPKFDIRPWKDDEEKGRMMQKGVTFSAEEMENLTDLLLAIREEDESEDEGTYLYD